MITANYEGLKSSITATNQAKIIKNNNLNKTIIQKNRLYQRMWEKTMIAATHRHNNRPCMYIYTH